MTGATHDALASQHLTTMRYHVELYEDLAIWSGEVDGDVDRPVLTNGLEQAIIPGSSLAGVLRHTLAGLRGDRTAELLFGDPQDEGGQGRIEIDDIVIAHELEWRDGVGIDRFTGAAATEVKYVTEVVPAGATGHGELRFRSSGTELHDTLEQLLAYVGEHGINVGSGGTRGRGLVRLTDITRSTVALTDRDALLVRLGLAASEPPAEVTTNDMAMVARLVVTVPLVANTPTFVGSGDATDLLGIMPLTTTAPADDGPRTRLLLPGSAIKGALRSHAERIERTMRGLSLDAPATRGEDFIDQLSGGDTPLSALLFGSARERRADDRTGTRGLLSVRSVTSRWSCAASDWRALLTATDTDPDANTGGSTNRGGSSGKPKDGDINPDDVRELAALLEAVSVDPGMAASAASGPGVFRLGVHNAIDRWTGGVADGMLYSVCEPHAVAWNPLELSVQLPSESDETLQAALFLVLLVVRDLCAGDIGLGWGVNRGYGHVSADPASVTVAGLPGTTAPTTLDDLLADGAAAEVLQRAWLGRLGPVAAKGASTSAGETLDSPGGGQS